MLTCKYIQLIFDLPRIDHVEELQENEGVEDDGVVALLHVVNILPILMLSLQVTKKTLECCLHFRKGLDSC